MVTPALSRVVTSPTCKQRGLEIHALSIPAFLMRGSSCTASRCTLPCAASVISSPAQLQCKEVGLGSSSCNTSHLGTRAAIFWPAVCPTNGRQDKKAGLAIAAEGGIWKLSSKGIKRIPLNVHDIQMGSRIGAKKNNKTPSLDEGDFLAKQKRDMQNIERSMPDFDELDRDELDEFLDLELESSGDFETYKHYEIMFLIHEKNADEVQVIIKMVQGFIAERKGVVYRLNDWGMRNLAYKIKKATRANYILMNIEVKAQDINSLDALLEKDERVIRHMIMSQKAAISEECKPPEEYRPSRIGEEEQAIEDAAELEEGEDDEGEEEEVEEDKSELVLQRE